MQLALTARVPGTEALRSVVLHISRLFVSCHFNDVQILSLLDVLSKLHASRAIINKINGLSGSRQSPKPRTLVQDTREGKSADANSDQCHPAYSMMLTLDS